MPLGAQMLHFLPQKVLGGVFCVLSLRPHHPPTSNWVLQNRSAGLPGVRAAAPLQASQVADPPPPPALAVLLDRIHAGQKVLSSCKHHAICFLTGAHNQKTLEWRHPFFAFCLPQPRKTSKQTLANKTSSSLLPSCNGLFQFTKQNECALIYSFSSQAVTDVFPCRARYIVLGMCSSSVIS